MTESTFTNILVIEIYIEEGGKRHSQKEENKKETK